MLYAQVLDAATQAQVVEMTGPVDAFDRAQPRPPTSELDAHRDADAGRARVIDGQRLQPGMEAARDHQPSTGHDRCGQHPIGHRRITVAPPPPLHRLRSLPRCRRLEIRRPIDQRDHQPGSSEPPQHNQMAGGETAIATPDVRFRHRLLRGRRRSRPLASGPATAAVGHSTPARCHPPRTSRPAPPPAPVSARHHAAPPAAPARSAEGTPERPSQPQDPPVAPTARHRTSAPPRRAPQPWQPQAPVQDRTPKVRGRAIRASDRPPLCRLVAESWADLARHLGERPRRNRRPTNQAADQEGSDNLLSGHLPALWQ